MKLRKTLRITIVAMAFFAAVGAATYAKDSRDVVLHSDATLAGSRLASGSYKVQWQTHSPEATVTFFQGSKVVATAGGKVVDNGKRYSSNEVVYDQRADGSRMIRELRFRGSSEVIVFNE